MYKSNTPQDTIIVSNSTTYSATGLVTWAKTGLTYVDVTGVGEISVQVVGAHTSAFTFQGGNDLTDLKSLPFQNEASVPLAENTSVTNTTGLFTIAVRGYQYFAINVTSYTSSPTIKIRGRAGSAPMATQPSVAILEAGTASIGTVGTKTDLTPSAPTAASVGVTSAQAVASAATRKGLILTNTSSNYISLGFGANAAVLYSGVTLAPYGTFTMDEYTFDTGAINAIASVASSNLAIQEFLT